jgi:hypothetical protein
MTTISNLHVMKKRKWPNFSKMRKIVTITIFLEAHETVTV